jgi:hypothetical protein
MERKMSTVYLDRIGASAFIREQGVPLGNTALANLASDAKGPHYAIINGRALYQREDLLKWICAQAGVPPRRRREAAKPNRVALESAAT